MTFSGNNVVLPKMHYGISIYEQMDKQPSSLPSLMYQWLEIFRPSHLVHTSYAVQPYPNALISLTVKTIESWLAHLQKFLQGQTPNDHSIMSHLFIYRQAFAGSFDNGVTAAKRIQNIAIIAHGVCIVSSCRFPELLQSLAKDHVPCQPIKGVNRPWKGTPPHMGRDHCRRVSWPKKMLLPCWKAVKTSLCIS